MRKINLFIIAIISVQFAGCNGNNLNEVKSNTNESLPQEKVLAINEGAKSQEKKAGTIKLNKEKFLKLVWDYEKSPQEWKYIGDKPAIIDFYADWCGPCKMMAPIMEELASDYKDKIYIYKIDTDVEQELAAIFRIQSLPTFMLIPMSKKPEGFLGARNKEFIKEAIDKLLLAKE